MGEGIKEKLYIAVMAFCTLVCMALISSMLNKSSILIKKNYKLSEVNIMTEENKEIFISEDYIAGSLGKYLPKDFPKEDIKVKINNDGTIYTGVTAKRAVLENMIGSALGFREKMLLKLLPTEFGLGLYMRITQDEENSLVNLEALGVNINGMDMKDISLPSEITSTIAKGVNDVLIESGFYFTKIEILEGKIKLIA